MSTDLSWPGLFTLAVIYLSIGGLATRFLLELALLSVPPRRARARWAMALSAFALAIAAPLGLLAFHVLAAPSPSRLPAPTQWAADAGLLVTQPVADATAWLNWMAVGWPAWAVVYLWLAGLGWLTLRGGVAAIRLAHLRRRWREAPADLRSALDWPDRYPLRVGDTGMPLAVGGRRRAAFLPLWMVRELDPAAVRSVARHELAHLRWHDPTIDTAVRLLRSAFWLSIPLWSLERRIRREREAAADREAIQPLGPPPSVYAETLARVAARQVGWTPAIGASGDLEERVRRLLGPARRAGAAPAIVAGLVLAAGTLVAYQLPIPAWHQAVTDERAHWGPLDHALGYNPVVRATVSPTERRVMIQGYELSPEEVERWLSSLSLTERAQMVREAERRADPAALSFSLPRDGP